MAHKVKFVVGHSLSALGQQFDELVVRYNKLDPRYVITPIGFVSEETGYVIAVHVEAAWKRVFDGPEG